MAWTRPERVAGILAERHYLGPLRRGLAWQDGFGVIIVTAPTSRRLPGSWLELARWCITSREKNAGSQQWAAFVRSIRHLRPDCTTIVSYSDPSVGHTGALYRACNWRWAPTWHRLRPPPTGNGSWQEGRKQSVKDRWIFPLQTDPERASVLALKDEAILRAIPEALYREPAGVPFKTITDTLSPP